MIIIFTRHIRIPVSIDPSGICQHVHKQEKHVLGKYFTPLCQFMAQNFNYKDPYNELEKIISGK